MHIKLPQTLWFFFIGTLCLVMKAWHMGSTHENLLFMLGPLNFLLEISHASQGFFDPEIGYQHPALNIVIDKSCSGFNFWIISFAAISSLKLKSGQVPFPGALGIMCFMLLSYLITLLANYSRITVAIQSLHLADRLPWLGSDWFHQASGSFTYLCCLLLAYFFLDQRFNKTAHAQPA